jgi:GNAT superfamily N-acetyltransferase
VIQSDRATLVSDTAHGITDRAGVGVDHQIRAQTTKLVRRSIPTRGRDHAPGAKGTRQLHTDPTDPRRCARDQDVLAGSELSLCQRVVLGQQPARQPGGQLEIDPSRRQHQTAVNRDQLGARQVAALAHQQIGVVEPSGRHAHQDILGPRAGSSTSTQLQREPVRAGALTTAGTPVSMPHPPRAARAPDKVAGMEPLAQIVCAGDSYTIRRALAEDVATIVQLLAADQIGQDRDGGDLAPYQRAFASIDADSAQLLIVIADAADVVVGTLQLSFIPGLARSGALRAQIEAVRVAAPLRGRGVGAAMLSWAIEEAQRRDCALVQLTSDKRRSEAHRLYGRLGFVASHDGFKLRL